MSGNRVRVALVEVPAIDVWLDDERTIDDFSLAHPKYPQLVLAANLRRAGIDVDFVDLKTGGEVESVPYGRADYCGHRLDFVRVGVPFANAADRLLTADVVGISANFTFERSAVIQTIDFIRSRTKRPLIVVGGHDATADPAYYLRRGADLCVLGEGESAIQEIALQPATNNGPPDIGGIAMLRDGVVQRGKRRQAHRFEEIALPGVDLLSETSFSESPDGPLPPDVVPRIAALETSRGCGEACSFCDVTFVVGAYRPMPFEMVERQVRAFKTAGIRTIQVIDDNLLYRTLPCHDAGRGRQFILDLFRLLYDEGFAWEFFNGFQLGLFERDGAIDLELIEALYRGRSDSEGFVGCFRSYVPLDKVTPEEMSLLRKLKPVSLTRDVVAAIAGCGVPALALGFVIGSIRETPRTLEETIAAAEDFAGVVHRSSGTRTTPIVLPLCSIPLPGTPDFRIFHDHIAYPADEYPELYNICMSVLRTEHFSPLEMTRQRRSMLRDLNQPAAERCHDEA